MPNTLPATDILALIILDREAETPLHRQIYDALQQAILNEQLAAGMRLPSTRDLARWLAVSRNTVLHAVEQLHAEGYLETVRGAGTFINPAVQEVLRRTPETPPPAHHPPSPRPLTPLGEGYRAAAPRALQAPFQNAPDYLFNIGLPDLTAFPQRLWGQLSAKYYKTTDPDHFRYPPAGGYPPLQAALAAYLRAARGVRCEPSQILVTGGAQQALYLLGHVLLEQGDGFWMENPGYQPANILLRICGGGPIPVPVDEEGLRVEEGIERGPGARLAYVTPSHQYPLGYAMSLARRLALLAHAARAGMWVVEDDYDSEFRFGGTPIPALQGLDEAGRVIYVGTLSKTLSPALRLGYMILPPDLVDAFRLANAVVHQGAPLVPQMVLAEFISEGHLSRHIRRLRKAYAEKQAALRAAWAEVFGDELPLLESDTGLHVTALLPAGQDDGAIARRAAENGLVVNTLSDCYAGEGARPGLLLGYGAARLGAIGDGVRALGGVLDGG